MDDDSSGTTTPAPETQAQELTKPAPYKVNQVQNKGADPSSLTTKESK
jgi:hypothetical protein